MLKQIKKTSTGFTMLEMLIALLILSIGLLGVAALQTRGQQFNQVGYLRTQATFMAYDLMDRIRINKDDSSVTNNGENGAYAIDSCSDLPGAVKSCDTQDCLVEDLVTYDLDQWCGVLEETFPDGDVAIAWDGAQYDITISWQNILDRDSSAEKETSTWELQL